jgi:hypothetical protein
VLKSVHMSSKTGAGAGGDADTCTASERASVVVTDTDDEPLAIKQRRNRVSNLVIMADGTS